MRPKGGWEEELGYLRSFTETIVLGPHPEGECESVWLAPKSSSFSLQGQRIVEFAKNFEG